MTFEERLHEYNPYSKFDWKWERECFSRGAHWAREETIREVMGLLRSESADTACGMMELEFKDSGNQHVCSTDWAVWLESKLKEPTVVMKDESFKLPEFY